MAKKREINREDYPMVVDWSGYQNTHSKLLCRCDRCGGLVYKSIDKLDFTGGRCVCRNCRIDAAKDATFEKYSVENVFQLDEVKEKSKQTCQERYGVNHPMKAV